MPITRIQGPKRGIAGNSSSLTVTLDNTPITGNVLIAVIGTYGSYPPAVDTIVQTSGTVTWAQQAVSSNSSLYGRSVEIWAGVVQGSVSSALTITLRSTGSGSNSDPVVADVCEYSGLNTSSLKDVSATASGTYTNILSTGSINTNQSNELWIGGIFNVCDASNGDTGKSPTNGFSMFDGVGAVYSQTKALAYLEKIVSSTGSAACNVTGGSFTTCEAYVGCIAAFKGSTGATVYVPYNGRYSGDSSKQNTITYTGNTVIMQIDSNASDVNSNAVIENLIIDGQNQTNSIGIQLQNVSNCIIRNVTIMNCDVGIHLLLTSGPTMQGNRFEHIRMINVKQGIFFEGNSTYSDFSFTTIDDVSISLPDYSYPNGMAIKVGQPYATLYNTFIKATVWLRSSNAIAMVVNGQIKYSLVNLEVEQPGTGVQVTSSGTVNDNQSFLLTTFGVTTPKSVSSTNDIIVKP
jgi:parallel beta-helix repeat (two copies)